jgi:hypothetical protein
MCIYFKKYLDFLKNIFIFCSPINLLNYHESSIYLSHGGRGIKWAE